MHFPCPTEVRSHRARKSISVPEVTSLVKGQGQLEAAEIGDCLERKGFHFYDGKWWTGPFFMGIILCS